MLALLSTWTGLLALLGALAVVIWGSLFRVAVPIALYTAIFSLTFAGLALWSLRHENHDAEGVAAQRTQCYVGAVFAFAAICIVYSLFHFAQ